MAQTLQELQNMVLQIQTMAATLKLDLSEFQFSGDFVSQAGTIRSAFENLQTRLEASERTFKSIDEQINLSLRGLTSQKDVTKKLLSTYNSLATVVKKLALDEEGIARSSKGELTTLLKKAQLLKAQAESQKDILEAQSGSRTPEQQELIAAIDKETGAYERSIKAIEERLDLEKKIQSASGITGGLLDNLSKLGVRAFGGLGINLAALGVSFDDAEKDMVGVSEAFGRVAKGSMTAGEAVAIIKKLTGKELSEDKVKELASALEGAGNHAKKFQIRTLALKAGLAGIGEGVKEAFVDPIIPAAMVLSKLSSSIIQAFLNVDKARVEFERLNGSASSLNIQMMSINTKLTDTVDLLKQAGTFTQLTGLNAEAFSKEIIVGAAEAVNLLGLTNEQAGKLGIYAQATGKSYENTANSLVSGVNSFNSLNKTAVSHGLVMRDVSNSSDAVAASLGSSMERLTGAASSARRLGLELKDLEGIASSLLDFESSIEAELEAQLLTGKNINLTKARELALSNDLEGVGKELFNNSASLFEFGKMNMIQQESYAKALGLSREQLAKMAYQRAIENKLTGEALQNATGMTKQQLEAMEITVMMEKAVTKVTQAFTPLIKLVAEYGEYITGIVAGFGTLYILSKSLQVMEAIRTGLQIKKTIATQGEVAAQAQLNALKLVGLQRDIASAMAKAATNPILAIAGLAAAAAVGTYFATRGDDIVSKPTGQGGYGQRTLLMPEGAIALNNKDTIVAGTNLAGTETPNRSNEETNQLLKQLISETRKKQNIYLGHAYRLNEGLEVYS